MLAQGPAEETEKQLSLSRCAQAAVTARGQTEEQCWWGIMPQAWSRLRGTNGEV